MKKTRYISLLIIILIILTFGVFNNTYATDDTSEAFEENIETNENNNSNEPETVNVNISEEENNTENTGYEYQEESGTYQTSQVSYAVENNNYTEPTYTNTSETKSSNVNLKYLSLLNVEGLSPEFNKNITEYYLLVGLDIEKIDIEAIAEDKKSTVSILGANNLEEGENIVSIIVTAEDGTTKKYTINVTKTDDLDSANAALKTLSIKGFNFYPSFKPNIYNYNLTINEKITQLEFLIETEIEEASYEIIGNENLTEGDNLIKIIVTAKDGETKREYKINTFISAKNVQIKKENKNIAIIIISILAVAIISTTIAIYKKK